MRSPNKIPVYLLSRPGWKRFTGSWWCHVGWWIAQGWFHDLSAMWHRARYGWAPRDVANLSDYLNGVLGGALEAIAERGGSPAGYPNRAARWADLDEWEESDDVDAWGRDLRRWSAVFATAARDDLYELHGHKEGYEDWRADEDARHAAVHDALKEIEPWWQSFWC